MQIDYSRNKLRKQLTNATELKKAYGVHAKRIANRLDDIAASPNLAVLIQIPAANCHQLSGKRKSEWAVAISGNYRLIFEIDCDPIPLFEDGGIETEAIDKIRILEIVDYH
jgi:proteic killer suppression protein